MATIDLSRRPVRISSEASAWIALESVLERGAARRRGQLVISKWSHLDLTYWVGNEDAVITPPIMKGLLDLQEAILRTRFIAVEGSADLRGVGKEEREKYEIRAKISPGSSGVEVDLTEISKHLITELAEHMPAEYVLGLGLAAILAWAGQSCWRSWLDSRKETTLAEIEAGKTRDLLEQQRFANETDLARWKIYSEAQQRYPQLVAIESAVEQARLGIVKAASFTDRAKIAGRIVSPEVADELTQRPVLAEERADLHGVFRILYIDTTVSDGFKARLEYLETGEKLSASVQDAMLSERDRELIRQGEWQKKPIEASVRVKRKGGSVTSAVIHDVIRVVTEYS